jgi:hypothetical protein
LGKGASCLAIVPHPIRAIGTLLNSCSLSGMQTDHVLLRSQNQSPSLSLHLLQQDGSRLPHECSIRSHQAFKPASASATPLTRLGSGQGQTLTLSPSFSRRTRILQSMPSQ